MVLKEKKDDLKEEKLRLTKAQADKIELETEIKRGNYVNADLADKYFGDLVYAFRNKILTLPRALCRILADEKDPIVIEEILMNRFTEILMELSNVTLKRASRVDEDDLN